jgi:hypothetical protein
MTQKKMVLPVTIRQTGGEAGKKKLERKSWRLFIHNPHKIHNYQKKKNAGFNLIQRDIPLYV